MNKQFNYAPYRNAYELFKNAQNPQQLFTSLSKTNPNLKPIVDMLNKGMSPQQVFNTLCQQKGINPDEFIKNLTGK